MTAPAHVLGDGDGDSDSDKLASPAEPLTDDDADVDGLT
jgi:hypothetical protein